jgi:hypothetical protein
MTVPSYQCSIHRSAVKRFIQEYLASKWMNKHNAWVKFLIMVTSLIHLPSFAKGWP